MEHLLGTNCILSDMGARSPLPGIKAQDLHRDGGMFVPNPAKPFYDHTRSTPANLLGKASSLLRRLWGFECQSAWEESPRHFRIIDADGPKHRFEYGGAAARSGAHQSAVAEERHGRSRII